MSDSEEDAPVRIKENEDLDDFGDDSDDDSDEDGDEVETSRKRKKSTGTSKRKKKKKKRDKKKRKKDSGNKNVSMIDDAAELSGAEDDDDDEEDDDDDESNKDYIRDGFVVDEDEEEEVARKKKRRDELEDSDEDDDDDDDDDEASQKKKNRIRRLRDTDVLDDDDMDLINEARGEEAISQERVAAREAAAQAAERKKQASIMAQNEDELRKGLFHASDSEGDGDDEEKALARKKENLAARGRATARTDQFDDDAMDDFIDDDIGDQDDIHAADKATRRSNASGKDDNADRGVSEAQLAEASDIFGTDYLEFMGGQQDTHADEEDEYDEFDDFGDGKKSKKFRERGVGVDLTLDSDDEIQDEESDDDDDDELFGSDVDEADGDGRQRAEALKLRREKRKLAKAEKKRQAMLKKTERRKAKLRRAFEPVQLVENFCTDRDDEIRMKDAPERFHEWTTPFHGAQGGEDVGDEEEEQATWIMGRIPEIASEFFSPPPKPSVTDVVDVMDIATEEESLEDMEARQRAILDSIMQALRFMHKEQLEPEFIRKYRVDVVTSLAVRNNLHRIMDEDAEWERMTKTRSKTEVLLGKVSTDAEGQEAMGAEEQNIIRLSGELQDAQGRLDESLKEEERIKGEIDAVEASAKGDDDDDDELFGNDDDDEDDAAKKAKSAQKLNLEGHLKTIQILIQERAERVAGLATSLKASQAINASSLVSQSAAIQTTKKISYSNLWNSGDYRQYLSSLTDHRHIMDVYGYLNLVKEGNNSIVNKNALQSGESERKKRSRRFDRDYYRTCVSEGLRGICYQFVLAPFRAGIKLEDNMTLANGFSYERALPGDKSEGENGLSDPRRWIPPAVPTSSPTDFASDKVGSGELVLLSSTQGNEAELEHPELKDPLRGCRYVAAMELAYEPRIRRHLRSIFKAHAVLSTRPTSKGMNNIDAFHEYYGFHLIRSKPIKDHFPMDEQESERKKFGLSYNERKEVDEEMNRRERLSCLQFLSILKAERAGEITVCVHMPLLENHNPLWYKDEEDVSRSRETQDLNAMMEQLERVYLPPDGDMDESNEWNEERRKILRLALTNFILPQFEAECRRDLREASTKIGISAAAENLRTMAMEGPYRPSHLLGENRFLVPTGDLPIVGVCCASDPKEATYLASTTEQGELGDHFAIPSGTRIDDSKMSEKVITFLIQARPSVVVVGTGGGLASRLLTRKLGDLVTQATERWNNRFVQAQDEDDEDFETRIRDYAHEDDDEEPWKCNVDLVEDNVAQLFGRSVRGKKEFPDMAVNLKCAVATARHAKNPLSELAYTWSVASDAGVFGTELLFLNIHPLQQLLPKPLLLRQYERVLCNAVAEVGVDINAACTYDHLHGMLSFVPGLGPRKAASLKQTIIRIGGVVASRRALLQKRLMGPIVYNNAVAFLRIRETDQLANQLLHPLDDTRLHPDVYHRNNWAVKIAVDALELGDGAGGEGGSDKESIAITALRDVMQDSHDQVKRLFDATKAEWEIAYGPSFNVSAWDPRVSVPTDSWRDKVEELDLETFAKMIEQSGLGKWLSHLIMIKWEFRLPFEDPRKPMDPLTGERLFRLLTGETDQSLCPGKEVTGKIIRNGDFGSRIKLEGEIPAFVPLRNLSDENVESADDFVTVGSVVTAVVTEVKKDHMCVDLSLRMEDFRKLPSAWERPQSLPALDMHFDRAAAMRIEKEKSDKREKHLESLQLSTRTKIGDDDQKDADGSQPRRRTGRVTRRACAHPAFRNAKNDEVNKELRDGGEGMVGEALLRPSSDQNDALALHWMLKPGCIKIIRVEEEGKDTDASIGNVLKIKNEAYGSIDELLGRYVAPLNDRLEEVNHHRKFLDMLEDDLDQKLKDMKKANPAGIHYFVCWNEEHPGYISLRFIMSNTPRHHNLALHPEGFMWGHTKFSSLDHVLNAFKKNPRGPGSSGSNRPSASSGGASRSMAISAATNPPAKPSRWGARPPPPAATAPPPSSGWGAPVAATASSGWDQPPPRPPPPSMPPPPHGYQPPPPSGPPPSFGQPPPPYGQPPPHFPYQRPPPPGGPPPPGYPPRVQQ